MWRVLENVYDDDECRLYINRLSTARGCMSNYSLIAEKFIDTPRNGYRIQEDSLENEDCMIIKLNQTLVPFALKIDYEDLCSAIVKVYGGVQIKTNGNSTIKWYLLYKKNGDVSNNSTLSLAKPHMNCERAMNMIRIHYDYRRITNPFSYVDVTCFGPNEVQKKLQNLQTVNNNKNEILKVFSKTKIFQTKSVNEKKLDFFPILPNEMIAKIFGYLDLKTLGRTAQVCSRFNDITTKTDNLYFNLDFKSYWNVFSATVFDRFMDKTKNLKKLDLSWCHQSRNTIYDLKLAQFLDGSKNTLTHLYIEGGDLSDLKDSLISAVFACKELLELHLRSVDLELVNGDWFNAGIIQCKNLRKLDLTNSITNYVEFITIISKTRKLKHLVLDAILIFDRENEESFQIVPLDKILEKLVEFDINLETWSSWGGDYKHYGSLSLFEFHKNLEELDLSHYSPYTNNSPPTITLFTLNFLAKCSRLRRLSLAGWRDIEDIHLTSVTENCKKLEQVNISYLNLITATSIKGFLKLKNLKILNIRYCCHKTISLSQIEGWQEEYPQVKFII